MFRFTTPHHREGFELFLDTIVAMEDVWLVSDNNRKHILKHIKILRRQQQLTHGMFVHQVSAWQTIQWMRDPQPIERAESFPPFQCDYKVFILNIFSSCHSGDVAPAQFSFHCFQFCFPFVTPTLVHFPSISASFSFLPCLI